MTTQNNSEKKFHYSNVILVSLTHMLHDIYSSFLAPLLPLLIEKLSISYSLAGLLSVFQRLPSLLNPFIGLLADKVNVKYFVIIAPAITTLAMSLIGIAPSYTFLAVLLLVSGISSTIFHVPSPVMIKEFSANKVGRGMSFYMLGGELARTLGPISILGAVSIWGLEGTYRLIPFGFLASLLLFLRLRNVKVSSNHKHLESKDSIKMSIKHALPTLTICFGVMAFRAFMKSSLTAFLPIYITSKGNSLWLGGISLSILQLAGAVGTFFMGSISDKIGRKNTLYIATISAPVFMFIFLVSEGVLSLILLILIGFAIFATGPVLLAFVQDIESERPAFINGLFMAMNFLISAFSITAIGIGGDIIGLETTYLLAALLALGSIPFVFLIKKKVK
ncbi:MAG: MFS transporter [Melioribacteraceae bacterium]|nr:MFS transporter [Melioribacteraceae bacterium]